jgi:hypothetical protein
MTYTVLIKFTVTGDSDDHLRSTQAIKDEILQLAGEPQGRRRVRVS